MPAFSTVTEHPQQPGPTDSSGDSRPAPHDIPLSEAALDSAELFRNRREVLIRHGGELYRLRLTKSGKLILHK